MKIDTDVQNTLNNTMPSGIDTCQSPTQSKLIKTVSHFNGEASSNPSSPALSTSSNTSGTSGRAEPPKRLRYWLIDMIDSGDIPGLRWENSTRTIFRIPWKHAGKNNWKEEDCKIFKAWAEHRGKYRQGDKVEAATWKTRLRCALNKLPDIKELKDLSYLEGNEPYRVYQLLPEPDKTQENEIYPRSSWGKESPSNAIHHSPLQPDFLGPHHQDKQMQLGHTLTQSTFNNTMGSSVPPAHLALTRPPTELSNKRGRQSVDQNTPPGGGYPTIHETRLNLAPPPDHFHPPKSMFSGRHPSSDGYDQRLPTNQQMMNHPPQHGMASPSDSDTLNGNMDTYDTPDCQQQGFALNQVQPVCDLLPPDRPPQHHEMEIYIKYRGFTVMAHHVTEPTGCRVHYGDASLQLIAVAQHELPSSVFGPESLQQIGLVDCSPYAVSQKQVDLTNHVLNNIKRGLILYYDSQKGCFFAKRLCQSRVFFFGPESTGTTPEKLDRNKEVKVFDYHNFCNQLRRFSAEGRLRAPEMELKASFGQNWSIKTPLEKNLVTLFMIPRAAKFLLYKVRERHNNTFDSLNDSIHESGPDSYDRLADRATMQSGKCIDELIEQMAGMDPNAPLSFRHLTDTRAPTSQQNASYATGFFQENVIHTAPLAMNDVEMTGFMQ